MVNKVGQRIINLWKLKGKSVRLPKIGWVKMFEKLRFVGPIIKVTISRTAHRWFVSITVEVADDTYNVENSTKQCYRY